MALFVLGLLESGAVLVRDLLPNLPAGTLPPLQNSALTLGIFGLFAAIAASIHHDNPFRSQLGLPVATGLTLFAVPIALSSITSRYIPPLTVAAIQTLAPLFTIVLQPYLASGTASESNPRFGILPALLAFSGVLLIFPVFAPSSYTAALALAAALAAAFSMAAGNCLIVRAATTDSSLAATAASATVSASLGLCLASALFEQPHFTASVVAFENIWPLVLQLFALALLFWLARRLNAIHLATRAIWVLILPILIEAVFLPVHLGLRNWSGISLMAAGAGALLFLRSPSQDQYGLSLR